jgi:UPF0042 nucleotide-binding protein
MTAAASLPRRVVLLTGLSGAGLSTALKALEDLGYKAVDNLPLSMVDTLLAQKEGLEKPVAIGIDSRTWDFDAARLVEKYKALQKKKGLGVSLVFMDCDDRILQQRFTETRRVHPLAVDRPVADGVTLDRAMVGSVAAHADLVLDTADLKPRDLRRQLAGQFKLAQDHGLFIFVTSFGFKNGLPRDADLVFDARFLENPYWDAKLRPLSGLDAKVAAKIAADPGYGEFFAKLTDLLGLLLPRYYHEGKNYLTLAIGCTGGRHRSVFIAEELFKWIDAQGYSVAVRHRDMEQWARTHAAQDSADKQEDRKKEIGT